MLLVARYIVPVTSEPVRNGAVLVRDGRIADIGPADKMRMRYADEEVKDFNDSVILPGFIDAHSCLEQSVLRGSVIDAPFVKWVQRIEEQSRRLDAADWIDSAMIGGLDCIANGITCVADRSRFGASIQAVDQLGLRGIVYREVGALDRNRIDHAMNHARRDIEEWRDRHGSSRVSVGIAPKPLYDCHPLVLKRTSQMARELDLPVSIYLAGSRAEWNFVKYGSSEFGVHAESSARGFMEVPPWLPTGTSPIRYALNWDAFEADRVMAVHCNFIDGDDDIRKLKEYDVSVCACPRAAAQLGMGISPVDEFLRAGIPVGIGTDSPASVDTLDLIYEARLCMLMQRAINTADFMSSETALRLVTIDAARALGLDDEIGSLEVGKCADIVALDLSGSHESAASDPSSLVLNACQSTDVVLTMVGGSVLYEKNKWNVDVEVAKHIARVIEIRGKLRK